MPKKKTTTTAPAQDPQTPAEEYLTKAWAGQTLYQCCLCPAFDTFDRGQILEHLVNIHNSEKALEELYSATSTTNPNKEISNATTDPD